MPLRPMARPPAFSRMFTRSLFTLPASTIWTMSAVSLSVTLRPSTNSLFLPTRDSMSVISGPPPWMSTTLMPTMLSSTASPMTRRLSSSLFIALPPYLMATTLPRYFCR